jgi:hypothetical protein
MKKDSYLITTKIKQLVFSIVPWSMLVIINTFMNSCRITLLKIMINWLTNLSQKGHQN